MILIRLQKLQVERQSLKPFESEMQKISKFSPGKQLLRVFDSTHLDSVREVMLNSIALNLDYI